MVENEKMVSIHFDSILEVMEAEESENSNNKRRFRRLMAGRAGKGDWYGPTNHDSKDVINHALLGDAALYENHVKDMLSQLEDLEGYRTIDYEQSIKEVKRRKIRSHFGDEIDIHKVYQGDLERAWSSTERVEVDRKHHLVTLLIDLVENSTQAVRPTLWKAAVAVFLQREIEKAGKSVRILVGSTSEGSLAGMHKTVTTSIVVKEYNQTLNFERLAAMTHLGFYRTFGFAAKVSQKHEIVDTYGRAAAMDPSNISIPLQEEIDAGHTKLVLIGGPKSLHAASLAIKNAYKQMESFAA